MPRRLFASLLSVSLLAMPSLTFARGRLQGSVERGGVKPVVNGVEATAPFQASYPSASVKVKLAGTQTLATIYSDYAGTSKSNPFTADTDGKWFLYADDGCYDVEFSGSFSTFQIDDLCILDPKMRTDLANISQLVAKDATQRSALCNGSSKPLANYYGTLTAAQVDYPDATALANELDWAVIQKALTSYNNAYIPGGKNCYINSPLLVDAGSVIAGYMGRGATGGAYSSQITVSGNTTGIQTKATQTGTSYIRISDLTINNADSTNIAKFWAPSTAYSVGNYTIPAAAIENGFVYKCTTAGTSGTVEPTWCTSPGCPVTSDGSAQWTAETLSRIGIDLSKISQAHLQRVSLRYHHAGIRLTDAGVAGYENRVTLPEIASCTYGIKFESAGNGNRIDGGHLNGNQVGVHLKTCNGNVISSIMEKNRYHVVLGAGASENVLYGNRFEGNEVTAGLETKAAILFQPGATVNQEVANSFSNNNDAIIDQDGSNVSFSAGSNNLYASPSGISAGRNLVLNPGMEVDADNDDKADGWNVVNSTGMQFAVDPNIFKQGSRSQKLSAASGTAAAQKLNRSWKVTPGTRYTISFWVYAPYPGVFAIRLGKANDDTTYLNTATLPTSQYMTDTHAKWQFIQKSFTSVDPLLVMTIRVNAVPAATTDFYIDALKLEEGSKFPTAFYEDTLESETMTVGALLSSAATIAPTHRIHHVTGTFNAISTITVPDGFGGSRGSGTSFAGPLYLIADGAWATNTSGNIGSAFTAVTNAVYVLVYDPRTLKWYVKP